MAQDYERAFIRLWDRLRPAEDKFDSLAEVETRWTLRDSFSRRYRVSRRHARNSAIDEAYGESGLLANEQLVSPSSNTITFPVEAHNTIENLRFSPTIVIRLNNLKTFWTPYVQREVDLFTASVDKPIFSHGGRMISIR